MPEDVKQCPLCGNEKSTLFEERDFKENHVVYRICQHCGLVFQSPRMTAEEADTFYQAEYRQMYQGDEGPNQKDLRVQQERAASLVGFLRRNVTEVKHHLDIGASSGMLLKHSRDAFGADVLGIEPGVAYREYAQGQQIPMRAALDELFGTDKKFDLISMSHVLEHLPDPVGYLQNLRKKLLAPDGMLLIEVPNLYAHDSFEVAHLMAFSPRTLQETLAKAGYEVVAFEAHGRPVSELFDLYLTLLACPQKNTSSHEVMPDQQVAQKRKWGMLKRRVMARLFPTKAWKSF